MLLIIISFYFFKVYFLTLVIYVAKYLWDSLLVVKSESNLVIACCLRNLFK